MKRVLILPVLFIAGMGAQAETCLSLDDAMVLAAERSPEVALADAARDSARAQLLAARSLNRPTLSAFARSGTGDEGLTDGAIENQIGLRAGQRLFDFGDARLARTAAEYGVGASDFDLQVARNETAFRLAIALIDQSELGEQTQALQGREAFFLRLLEASQRALVHGGVTRSDVLDVGARLELARAQQIEVDFQRELTRIDVETLIGSATCILEDAHLPLQTPEDALAALGEDRSAPFEPPRLEALQAEIGRREAEHERARRSRLPVIEAVGIASYTRDAGRDWTFRDRIGIDVSVPLLSGNLINAERETAAAELNRARAQLQLARRDLQQQLEVSRQRIVSLVAQQMRQVAALEQKRAQFEASAREFEAGFLVLRDHVEDWLDLEAAMLSEIALRHELMREQVRLDLLENRLLADPSRQLSQ